jgi:GAF domain-containing protein
MSDARAYVQLLRTVTVAANEASSLEEPLQTCLDAVCALTGWPVGHAYVRSTEPPFDLIPTKLWHLDDPERFATFRNITEATRLAPGVGLPGHVLSTGKPEWIRDVTVHANFPRSQLAGNIGVRAGFGFPIKVRDEVPAVLEFFTSEALEPDEEFLEIMDQVGIQLGRVIERMRAEESLRNLARGVAEAKGEAFFLSLAHHLVQTLHADYALIGALASPGAGSVRTLAACGRAGTLDNFEYRLEGTPCENVVGKDMCSYPRDVRRLFPRDRMLTDMGIEAYAGMPLFDSAGHALGLMVVLYTRPLANPRTAESLLQVFAVRAAAELERQRAQRALENLALFPRADPNPVLEFAADGTLSYWNAATERLARSMGKSHPREILPVDTKGIIRKCLETGVNGIVMETTGAGRTVSWAFIPVAAKRVVLAYAVEISFLLTLEAELRRLHMLDPPRGRKPGRPRGAKKGSGDDEDVRLH